MTSSEAQCLTAKKKSVQILFALELVLVFNEISSRSVKVFPRADSKKFTLGSSLKTKKSKIRSITSLYYKGCEAFSHSSQVASKIKRTPRK